MDEFLSKPVSPVALRQRLEMVIETPRPFIDSSIFLGPCRRRKNPADYYGERRRQIDRPVMIDQDEVARRSPIREILAELRETCATLDSGHSPQLASGSRSNPRDKGARRRAGRSRSGRRPRVVRILHRHRRPARAGRGTRNFSCAVRPRTARRTAARLFRRTRHRLASLLGQIIQKKNAA